MVKFQVAREDRVEAAIGAAVGQKLFLYDQENWNLHNDTVVRILDTIFT